MTDPEPGCWLRAIAPDTELGRLVAAHDWASTAIGDPSTWPETLRTAVRICLTSRFPMLILWGPDLIKIYNDGYRDSLGRDKHPVALGAPARDVWPEIWDTIGPLFLSVMTTGEATWAEHQRFVMERNGFPEETYFTFSYSPIPMPDGTVGGVLDVAAETTEQVVSDRRFRCLGDLASVLGAAVDVAEVCAIAVLALTRSPAELPSAKIRLRVGDQLVPVATSDRHLVHSEREVAVLLALAPGTSVVLDADWTPGHPARRVAVAIGDREASGVLTVSLNPLRPYDESYRSFIELVARSVGAALESAYRRSVELGEQRRISETLQQAMLPRINDQEGVAARYVPAVGMLSVGGDWYDVTRLPDGRVGMVVGDCVGHGIEAAGVMTQLRSVSRALLLEGRSPAQVVQAMDRVASSIEGGLSTTMVCAVVDEDERSLVYSTAGHPPPLVVSGGTGRWLDGARGLPLAIIERERTEATVDLSEGDVIVMYTDGLIEMRGEHIDLGLERLREHAEASTSAGADLATIADGLIDALVADRPRDDVALIVSRVGRFGRVGAVPRSTNGVAR